MAPKKIKPEIFPDIKPKTETIFPDIKPKTEIFLSVIKPAIKPLSIDEPLPDFQKYDNWLDNWLNNPLNNKVDG